MEKSAITYVMMWTGSLALAGFPFFAGYYSKDMILEAAYAAHSVPGLIAFWLDVRRVSDCFLQLASFDYGFSWCASCKPQTMASIHESPRVMTLPLLVLLPEQFLLDGLL